MDTPFIAHLKALIDEKHLLTHPFYQAWTSGELPIEVMQKYAEQYYHLEKNFPNFLAAMLATSDEADAREVIMHNFHDEAAGTQNHRELWLRFGEGIGATREGMKNSEMLPETAAAVATFQGLSEESYLLGSAALAAYESQVPAVAQEKIAGLVANYGIDSEETMKFFRLHGELDVEHADAWWDIINKYCTDEATKAEVEASVIKGRDALWGFLDGVVREYFPECECEMA